MVVKIRKERFLRAGLCFLLFLAQWSCTHSQLKVQRYGMVIGVKPEKIEYYKELHAHPWPGVIAQLKKCHIQNYSIYLKELSENQWFLFIYFEYTGHDFNADMAKMAEDATTQRWWKETDPCQIPIDIREAGEFWSEMEEVFHMD
ncbi:MAG: L-rhamnose mutarotase [Candidatus Omnitrophota bacterium]|jgi:L-rhamnose mutarotase|nr:MAG: L-rhamnose mutarotase [Candidatus Omnitrophota bacterium]